MIIVSPATKKRIEAIKDLKGALVGVPDPSSQAHLFLNFLLVRNGLSPNDITAVAVGNQAAGVAALEHGNIDVWSGFDPGVTLLLKRHPGLHVLADARNGSGVRQIFGTDACPGTVLYSTEDWLSRNHDAAVRLARSIQHSLQRMHAHLPEQIAARIPRPYCGDDDGVFVEALRHAMPAYSQGGVMPSEGAEAAGRALALSLEIVRSAHVDVSKTYTNEFVAQQ